MEYQLAKQLKESDDHVIKNQSKTNCEEYFQNPNKHLYVTISKSAIKNDKEEIHGICGFATEISKFSNYFNLENNYIFNNLSFKIWQINANGQIISVNKRALKLTNLTYEEILGKKMSDIFDFSVYKKEQEAMLFETGGTQLSIEEILVCKETSEQYTFISDKIIYNHPESKNASLIIFSRIKD